MTKKDIYKLLLGIILCSIPYILLLFSNEFIPLFKYKIGMSRPDVVKIYSKDGGNIIAEHNGPKSRKEIFLHGYRFPWRNLKEDESLMIVTGILNSTVYLYFDDNGNLIYKDSCPRDW